MASDTLRNSNADHGLIAQSTTGNSSVLLQADPITHELLVKATVIVDASTLATAAKQDLQTAQLQTLNSLVPSVYDYISLAYTGSNLTSVVFKSGGSGGTTVSTLTLSYTGSDLTSVTKT